MSYEKKYRERIIEYVNQGDTERETAKVFGLSRSTIQEWKRRLTEKGDLSDKVRKRPAKKLPKEKLEAYVALHPDAYLSEIAEQFGGTGEAVRQALKRHKITLKKRP